MRQQEAELVRQMHERQRAEKQNGYGQPTATQAAAQHALFNSRDYHLWPPEALLLAAEMAPKVVEHLTGFTAAIAAAKEAGHICRELPIELAQRLASISARIGPNILAAGEHAFDGFLSLAYVETDPEDRRQRALHRGLLGALLHFAPLRRRLREQQPEVIAIWRHTEMYLIADPESCSPAGDLLTGPNHAWQHAAHRQSRTETSRGGYVAHIVQMGGVRPRAEGRQDGTTGSLNIMTASFGILPRIFELCDQDGRPLTYQIMAEGGDLVDQLGSALGFDHQDEPVDLIHGPLFIGVLDLRSDGDPLELLDNVLREPVLLKRISTKKRKADGMAAAGETEQGAESAPRKKKRQKKIKQRAEGAQPGATEAMGFNFLTDGFARSSASGLQSSASRQSTGTRLQGSIRSGLARSKGPSGASNPARGRAACAWRWAGAQPQRANLYTLSRGG